MYNSKQVTLLREHVADTLEQYFAQLDGHRPADLYTMVLNEIEKPLIQAVLKYTDNNQSIAAKILGLSRGTLRKKIKQLT